jgi:Rieske Fe-S protein
MPRPLELHNRREFCKRITSVAAISSGVALFPACGGIALTANCTHQACVVSASTGSSFVCPCHGSEFDTSGRVIVGPAVAPLSQFPTQFANNTLTIT